MNENNVVTFPKHNPRAPDPEQVKEVIRESKEELIDMASENLIENLFVAIDMMGFTISGDECFKDALLVAESIKSLLARSVNAEHPLQAVATDMISLEDAEETTEEN